MCRNNCFFLFNCFPFVNCEGEEGRKIEKYFFFNALDWNRFGLYNFGLAGDCLTWNDGWLCLTLASDVWRLNRCHLANVQVVFSFEFALEFGFQRDEATNLHRSFFSFPISFIYFFLQLFFIHCTLKVAFFIERFLFEWSIFEKGQRWEN